MSSTSSPLSSPPSSSQLQNPFPESGSGSSSNEESFIYACYDILWRSGNGSSGPVDGYRGERIMIRCFDPEPVSDNEEEQATSAGGDDSDATIEVQYRYRAYFVYGSYEATYSCRLCDSAQFIFFDFELLHWNESMRQGLEEDAMTFEMVDGMVDDDGYPFLYWHMNCGYTGGLQVEVYGWAKKREGTGVSGPGMLSDAEKWRIEEYENSLYG